MTETKKVGRPAGRTHTVAVRIWLTPEQHAAYEADATALGMALSEWVRAACDSYSARGQRLRKQSDKVKPRKPPTEKRKASPIAGAGPLPD